MDTQTLRAKAMRTFQAARLNPYQDVSRKLPSGTRLLLRYKRDRLTLALRRSDTYAQEQEWQAVLEALALSAEIVSQQGQNEQGFFLFARDIPLRERLSTKGRYACPH